MTAATSARASSVEKVSTTIRERVAVLTINNPPVNSLHPDVQSALADAYVKATKTADVVGVVITGANGVFVAGADIEYLQRMQRERKAETDIVEWIRAGNQQFQTYESGPLPTVAAIDGAALGGGLELAMACNGRIGTNRSTFGLPELSLGIIPGLGGTQRLPRLVGLNKAIAMTLSGKAVNAKDAVASGLLDGAVAESELISKAIQLVTAIASGKAKRIVASARADRIGSYEDGRGVIQVARTDARKKSPQTPQAAAYLNSVEVGLRDGAAAGLVAESTEFARLVRGAVSRALIHMFFAQRATAKLPGIKAPPKSETVKTVAVLGGGTMGAGICIVYLMNGYHVVLKEINSAALYAGVERIVDQVSRVIKSRKLPSAAMEMTMRNLKPTTTFDGFDRADLVIEAAVESLTVKQSIWADLESVTSAKCILATNTSTIDINSITAKADATAHRTIGLHFFSPAHVMPLLEIIRTERTDSAVIAQSMAMAKRIKKTPVLVKNCVGFAANRGFFPYGQSAALLVDSGVAPYDIDKALERFGMPMGVFKMTDLSGVDIAIHVSASFNEAYSDRTYNSSLPRRLFEAKRLGQKTGSGYYKYQGKPAKATPDLAALTPFIQAARGDAKGMSDVGPLSERQLVEAILYPIVNEFARIVNDGVVASDSDVDVVSVMGYGFPSWRGGILHWAQQPITDGGGGGWKHIASRLSESSSKWGAHNSRVRAFYAPSAALQRRADADR